MGNTSMNTGDPSFGFDITEIHGLVKAGKKIEAVKRVHDATGWGLKASKDYVDKIGEGIAIAGAGTGFDESGQSKNTAVDLGPIKELLDKGCKVEAIKMLRDLSGLGLKDARDFVEQLANGTIDDLADKRNGADDPGAWKNEPVFKTTYSKTTVNGKEVKPGDPEWESVTDLFSQLRNKDNNQGDGLTKALDTFFAETSHAGSVKQTTGSYSISMDSPAKPDPVFVTEPVSGKTAAEQNLKKEAFTYDKGTKGGANIGLYIVIALIMAGIVVYLLNAMAK